MCDWDFHRSLFGSTNDAMENPSENILSAFEGHACNSLMFLERDYLLRCCDLVDGGEVGQLSLE